MSGFGKQRNNKNKSGKKNLPKKKSVLESGIRHHTKGDLETAEELYRHAMLLGCTDDSLFLNLGIIYTSSCRFTEAASLQQAWINANPKHPDAYFSLGHTYLMLGKLDQALATTLKSITLKPDNPNAHMNLGTIYQSLDETEKALEHTLKSLDLKPHNPNALLNLGIIFNHLNEPNQALNPTLKSLELKPNNPNALVHLGIIYKNLDEPYRALDSTLRSLELKPDNPDAYLNLGIIYQDLNDNDQALAATLHSLELKSNWTSALKNLKIIVEKLQIQPSNFKDAMKAYELLLNRTDISHQSLSKIFLKAYLPTIREASIPAKIVSDSNGALYRLSSDWRFRKSLTLIIPPNSDVEQFLTRLREEILRLTIQEGLIPPRLKPLTEALAVQCFLNEYVYSTSQEEEQLTALLTSRIAGSREEMNKYIAAVGCYTPLHLANIDLAQISQYSFSGTESKDFIATHLTEPFKEKEIKISIQQNQSINDTVSKHVQEMYEENPYPRFRYSDYTSSTLAKQASEVIKRESTKNRLAFNHELTSTLERPKVLIAGCGTGDQVIKTSRYKNAQVTAIDLSSSSIAYSIRKTAEYNMTNVLFKKMDILNAASLKETFDVIECSGVLHHMERPASGLSALVKQLKPGGYIKLGLYSTTARKIILRAQKIIKRLGIESTPQGIREFRGKVMRGEINELMDLPKCVRDFYSLSECRDLCFHVQEHCFTTIELNALLDSQNLEFCGFMLADNIKNLYHQRYPDNEGLTSLENWCDFEKEYPSTFIGMYQFWAKKPL